MVQRRSTNHLIIRTARGANRGFSRIVPAGFKAEPGKLDALFAAAEAEPIGQDYVAIAKPVVQIKADGTGRPSRDIVVALGPGVERMAYRGRVLLSEQLEDAWPAIDELIVDGLDWQHIRDPLWVESERLGELSNIFFNQPARPAKGEAEMAKSRRSKSGRSSGSGGGLSGLLVLLIVGIGIAAAAFWMMQSNQEAGSGDTHAGAASAGLFAERAEACGLDEEARASLAAEVERVSGVGIDQQDPNQLMKLDFLLSPADRDLLGQTRLANITSAEDQCELRAQLHDMLDYLQRLDLNSLPIGPPDASRRDRLIGKLDDPGTFQGPYLSSSDVATALLIADWLDAPSRTDLCGAEAGADTAGLQSSLPGSAADRALIQGLCQQIDLFEDRFGRYLNR